MFQSEPLVSQFDLVLARGGISWSRLRGEDVWPGAVANAEIRTGYATFFIFVIMIMVSLVFFCVFEKIEIFARPPEEAAAKNIFIKLFLK